MALAAWFTLGAIANRPVEAAATDDSVCLISPNYVVSPPKFTDYPASVEPAGKLAEPRLDSKGAKLFRTMLREGAARGPNFAGHYAIVDWGCGASCTDMAIVDTRSGKVAFDRRIRDNYTGHVGGDYRGFRVNSRLLVIAGMPQEEEARDGVTYFEWDGSSLKLIRFVPRRQSCRDAHG